MSKYLTENFECTSCDPEHWWTEKQDLHLSKIVSCSYYLEGDWHSFFYLGFLLKYASFLLPFSVHISVLFSMPDLEISGCSSFVHDFSSCHAPKYLHLRALVLLPKGPLRCQQHEKFPPIPGKLWGFALKLAATTLLASFPFQKHLHHSHMDPQSWCLMLWHQEQNQCWW